MRKTKIVCTLGPATDEAGILEALIDAGMDAARFNFSHGTHEEQKKRYENFVALRKDKPIPTILDTKGPEVRIGKFKEGKVTLTKGNTFTLTTKDVEGDQECVTVNYKDFAKDIKEGATILLDDGLIELVALKVDETDVVCSIKNTGVISNNKGVNLPGTRLSMPFISQKDKEDIIFGIENNFDFIAASFTRGAEDILEIRKILEAYDCHTIHIIAKIENREGVDQIDDIIRVADGIMVARGDMGVEIPIEKVPALQKMIIKKVYASGKQVITATQMLDSMMKNPRPTRAEATDVANAVYDGTSAIMLSGETAAGLYPVEAVKMMAKIALETEEHIDHIKRFNAREEEGVPNVTNAISHSTCTSAHDLKAAAIVTVTKSGKTARMISKYRPLCAIVGCATSKQVCRQLNLSWGVIPLLIKEEYNTEELFDHATQTAEKAGIVKNGDLVVITGGIPLGLPGTTNLMKIQVVGDTLLSGVGITNKSVCAEVCVCATEEEAEEKFNEGNILVIPQTTNKILPILKKAAGIITEQEGLNSHSAIVGLAIDIPVIIGATHATKILKTGTVVTLDAARGIVAGNRKA